MRLDVITGLEAGRQITIDRDLTLGRSAANDVMLADTDVSNYHARVRPVPGGVEVTDTGSRNGTYVNGARLSSAPAIARPGDQVTFAGTTTSVVDDQATVPPDSVPAGAGQATSRSPFGSAPAAPPAPAAPMVRTLVVRAGKDLDHTLKLDPGREYTIGRDPSSDLVLSDPRVSTRHAKVRLDGDRLIVEDLQSANGTLLNGEPITRPGQADAGAEIQAGETVLVYYTTQRTAGAFEPQPTIIGTIGAAATASVAAQKRGRSRLPVVLVGVVAVVALGAAIAAIALTAGGGGDEDEEPTVAAQMSIPEIIDELRPSVIQILTLLDPAGGGIGQGSGSVVDDREGFILTNNHVATGGELLVLNEEVGDEAFEAVLVAAAPCEDLALIRVTDDEILDQLEEVRFGDADDLRQGQEVVALGFPASAESGTGARLDTLSATSGIISKAETTYDNPGDVPPLVEAIQHQAAVNPGNSGGPLFDLQGRQIGVNTAIFFIEGRGRAEGENYAISVSRLEKLLPDLEQGISPKWLGTAFNILVNQNTGEPAGLGITGITPGSPGDLAGLQRGRDVIVEVDGEPVFDLHSYCEAMPEGEDETVELTVVDREAGEVRTVTVEGVGRYNGPQ